MIRRLVNHENPEGRETPLLLLADLRLLDPIIEIVYVGERMWWVGRVDPNTERTRRGETILKQMLALDDYLRERPTIMRNIMLGRLLQQGFARIEMYRDCGDPSGEVEVEWFDSHGKQDWYRTTILADIKERYHAFERDGGEAKVAERMAFTDGTLNEEASGKAMREYIVNDGLAHYRREVRNRVVFGHGGMTGGASRLLTP